MVKINMRVFKIIFLSIITVFRVSNCSPISSLRLEHREVSENNLGLSLSSSELTGSSKEDFYDQRQNGTENYRVHVDGLILVVAPAEALLFSGIPDNFSSILAPTEHLEMPLSRPQHYQEMLTPALNPIENLKPEKLVEQEKNGHRMQLKLFSFLAPFLRRMRHV